jgi:precorrin-6A/cobalt-precorrin-6A reductase
VSTSWKRPSHSPMRVLLLGGTSEGAVLAEQLAAREGLHVISSLAGRVKALKLPVGAVRNGGFGGVSGLMTYLQEEGIDLVVDATHPFAIQMSRHAEMACAALGLPLLAYARPPWTRVDGDQWDEVPDFKTAAELVHRRKGRVFLAIGRQEIAAFRECSEAHFVIRSIDMPDILPPHATVILDRGPFQLEADLEMLRAHGIDYVVCKNSGGSATYSKIEAARRLGLRVIMIQRPEKHTVPTCEDLNALLDQIDHLQRQQGFDTRQEGCCK